MKALLIAAIACNIAALSPAERREHADLTHHIFAAALRRTDLTNGYEFAFGAPISVDDLRRWSAVEARCCPFLHFAIDANREGVVMRLTGDGAKDFIDTTFHAAGPYEDAIRRVESDVLRVATAMPASKYDFRPRDGAFDGVRTFAQQLQHLAAANFELGAAILGEKPPHGETGEQAPRSVKTKEETVQYVSDSFDYLRRASLAIGKARSNKLDRLIDALEHSANHYGQTVEYLRMNGIVPPPAP